MLAAMAAHQTLSNFRTEIAPVDTKHLPKAAIRKPLKMDTILVRKSITRLPYRVITAACRLPAAALLVRTYFKAGSSSKPAAPNSPRNSLMQEMGTANQNRFLALVTAT